MCHKRVKSLSAWILCVICLFASNAFSLERFDIVTTAELKKMLDDRMAGQLDFLLVNGLDKIVYRDSSIPGSINIPWSDIKGYISELGADKEKLIITY
jgi:hypothetical protein